MREFETSGFHRKVCLGNKCQYWPAEKVCIPKPKQANTARCRCGEPLEDNKFICDDCLKEKEVMKSGKSHPAVPPVDDSEQVACPEPKLPVGARRTKQGSVRLGFKFLKLCESKKHWLAKKTKGCPACGTFKGSGRKPIIYFPDDGTYKYKLEFLKQSEMPVPPVTPEPPKPALPAMQEMGRRLENLGKLMQQPDTTIDQLAKATCECGLVINFSFLKA